MRTALPVLAQTSGCFAREKPPLLALSNSPRRTSCPWVLSLLFHRPMSWESPDTTVCLVITQCQGRRQAMPALGSWSPSSRDLAGDLGSVPLLTTCLEDDPRCP